MLEVILDAAKSNVAVLFIMLVALVACVWFIWWALKHVVAWARETADQKDRVLEHVNQHYERLYKIQSEHHEKCLKELRQLREENESMRQMVLKLREKLFLKGTFTREDMEDFDEVDSPSVHR